MKPSSLDLRQNILRAYDQQLGAPRALAALFGGSHACLEPWLPRRRATGDMAPRPHGGGRPPRCDPAALGLVRHLLQEPPAATLAELGTPLQQRRGVRGRLATMARRRKRLGLPRKKQRSMPRSVTRRAASRPAAPPVSG
jgi:transposase